MAMKPIRERNPILVGIAGLVIIAIIALLAFNAGNLPVIGGGTTYTAYFTEAAGLSPGNEVRVAGVKVGKVTGVSLAGDLVLVTFRVRNVWLGNQSTVAIDIKTLLGAKYLALDPLGPAAQNPGQPIPVSRTTSPFDVTQAFQQLGRTVGQLDTARIAMSLEALARAFAHTPPYVSQALRGLSALSLTISSRDAQIARLLSASRQITGTLASEDSRFRALITDGSLLLAELEQQQQAIGTLFTGTKALATQLSGLVSDDRATIGPMLAKLGQVTAVLERNQASLNRILALAGPYYRLLGNTLGNGRWFDSYLCGLVRRSFGGTQPATGCMPPKPGSGGGTPGGGG